MKRSPLARRTPLKRGGWLRRRKRKPAVVVVDVWREGLELCECVVCGVSGACQWLDGHHAVPKRVLLAHGLHDYVNDTRNRVPVCRPDHESHESQYRPIQRSELPASVFEFAYEIGMLWYLDRHYRRDLVVGG